MLKNRSTLPKTWNDLKHLKANISLKLFTSQILSVLWKLRKQPKIQFVWIHRGRFKLHWLDKATSLTFRPWSPLTAEPLMTTLFFYSPVKFVGGDCWPRGPTLTACPSYLARSSVEQPMDVTPGESMDTGSSSGSTTSEASAPLPIRHPAGISSGPYKKHTYPMNSKRPEHLRMNLWRSARLQTSGLVSSAVFFIV